MAADFETDEQRNRRVLAELQSGGYGRPVSDPNDVSPIQDIDSHGLQLSASQMTYRNQNPPQVEAPEENKGFFSTIGGAIGNVISGIPEALADSGIAGGGLSRTPDTPSNVDYAQRAADWIRTLPLYRSVMMTPEEKLQDAQVVGTELGLNPQALADNQILYEQAKDIYDRRKSREFLQGNPFNDVYKMYPELQNMGSVETAIALKNAQAVMATRALSNMAADLTHTLKGTVESAGNFVGNAWEAGQRDDQISEIAYLASKGEISTADMNRKIQLLAKGEENNEPDNFLEKIPYESIRQISMQKNQMVRAAGEVLSAFGGMNAAAVRAAQSIRPAMSALGFAGAALVGAGGSTAGVAAAAAGTVLGLGALGWTVYAASKRAQQGMNYYALMNKKNAAGAPLYTESEARTMAERQAVAQAFVEGKLMEAVYAPLAGVFGKTAATKAITDAAVRNRLLDAGRKTMARMAFTESLKQYGKAVGSEILEEGVQDLISNADERFFGKGNMGIGDMMNSAVDAMLQAAPAALGMSLPGAVFAGAGRYRGLTQVPPAEWQLAREAYQRQTESHMADAIVADREGNTLYKKNQTVYGKTIQNQLDQAGMGTIYIDARSAAEAGDKEQEALNSLVDSGIVTAEEMDDAINKGKPLEIQSGMYFQRIPDAKVQETLSDFSTMNKDGQTLSDIKENQKRLAAIAKAYNELKEDKSDEVARSILERDFPETKEEDVLIEGADTDNKARRSAAEDVLSRGLDNIQKHYQEAKKEALTQWGDLINVKPYLDYTSGGAGIISRIGEGGQYETVRVSGNEGWYSAWYREHKKAPGVRDRYYIAHQAALEEAEASGDPDAEAHVKELEDAKAHVKELEDAKARVEALDSLGDYFKNLDTDDVMAQKVLSKEAYDTIYKPAVETLTEGNEEVRKSAKASALLLARSADIFVKQYSTEDHPLTVKDVAATLQLNGSMEGKSYGQLGQIADARLSKDEKLWNQSVKKLEENGIINNSIRMMTTPLVFKLVYPYIDTLPLYIDKSKITTFMKKHPEIDWDVLRQIPRALANPIAITKSETEPNRYVAMIAVKSAKTSLAVIPMEFNVMKDRITANVITTVYGKGNFNEQGQFVTNYRWYQNEIERKAVYVDRTQIGLLFPLEHKKMTALLRSIGVQFPKARKRRSHLLINKIPDESDLVKLREKNPTYYQRTNPGYEPDLVAMHNISVENLGRAIELGGMPVPSIAITKKQTPYDKFGAVTLIMKKNVGDPTENPIYNRDAWTGVFPKVVRPGDKKKMEAYIKNVILPLQEEIPRGVMDYGNMYTPAMVWDTDATDLSSVLESFLRSDGARYLFLKSIGKEPAMKKKRQGLPKDLAEHPNLAAELERLDKKYKGNMPIPAEEGTEWAKDLDALKELILKEMFQPLREDAPAPLKRMRAFNMKSATSDRKMNLMLEDFKDRNKIVNDKESFRGALKKRTETKANAKAFEAWKKNFRNDMLKDPVIESNKKPATLDNIADAMIGNLKNAEKTVIGYGAGNAIASSAKRLHSIEEMHEEADQNMTTAEEAKAAYDATKKHISEFVYDMVAHYKYPESMDSYTDAAKVLGDMVGRGMSFSTAVRKNNFRPAPALKEQAEAIRKEIRALPMSLFEGKPQRAVHFDEVAAAVVPKGTPKKTTDYLKEQGITVRRYDPNVEGDRVRVTNAAQEKTKQYFQRAWHGSPYAFDRFDLGSIGNGEGGAAHGWGLYFAKNRKISEAYKTAFDYKGTTVTLNGKSYKLNEEGDFVEGNGKSITYGTPLSYALDALARNGTMQKAQSDINAQIRQRENSKAPAVMKQVESMKEARSILEQSDGSGSAGGKLYEVEIPDNKVLLDEQKGFGKQLKNVQKLLVSAVDTLPKEQKDRFWKWLLGWSDSNRSTDLLEGKRLSLQVTQNAFTWLLDTKFPPHKIMAKTTLKKEGYTDEQISQFEQDPALNEKERSTYESKLKSLDEEIRQAKERDNVQQAKRLEEIEGNPAKALDGRTGEKIYEALGYALGKESFNPRMASEYLSRHGIKGITYMGEKDGRCFVVFDDQAVSIIDRYNQTVSTDQYAGAYDAGKNIIHIFDGANASTVMHEAAHAWLTMLERMAAADPDNALIKKDLDTIRKWTSYTPESMKEYEGTGLEKEFQEHARHINEAKTPEERAAAEETWRQERFARGFERYLMTGSAPTKELRGVFRRFKAWLVDIYREAKNLGQADPPEDVRAIFDHMLAMDDEIRAWSAERQLDDMERQGYDFSKTEEENIRTWAENVRETTKEKLLKTLREEYVETIRKSFNDAVEDMRTAFQKQLIEENPVYKVEELYNSDMFPTKEKKEEFLRGEGYKDEQDFRKALTDAGGTMESRTAKYIEDARKQTEESLLTDQMIRDAADGVMNSPEGQSRLALMETAAMRRKLDGYIRQIVRAQLALRGKRESVYDIKKKLNLLTKEEIDAHEKKEREEKLRAERDLARQEKKDEQKAASQKIADKQSEITALENQLATLLTGFKSSQMVLDVSLRDVYRSVREQLGGEAVSQATNWKWWDKKAEQEGRRAADALARRNWDMAARAKRNQITYAAMARVARENETYIRKTLTGSPSLHTITRTQDGLERFGILGVIGRIGRKENPVRLEQNSRYFIQHLAFQLGLVPQDGELPIDQYGHPISYDSQAFFGWIRRSLDTNTLMELADRPSGDEIVAPWIQTLFDKDGKTVYTSVTMEQFKDLMQAIKTIYTVGRREYEGNTLKLEGKNLSFDEAAETIGKEAVVKYATSAIQDANNSGIKDRVKDNFSKAVLALTQPELILERIGEKTHAIIYDTIDRAVRRRNELTEEATRKMQQIFKIYSLKEWQEIRSVRKYNIGIYKNFTKEQVIAAALNYGTRSGRDRINQAYLTNDAEMEELFAKVLTDKDWAFIEAVWKHVNSFWGDRNKVQLDMTGVPMGKIPGVTFKIRGRTIEGKYYPMKYDRELSIKAGDNDVNDLVRQEMAGSAPFAIGMGSTKTRAKQVSDMVPDLSLDVYTRHIQEAIQHIAMREATTDVYKLLTRKDVQTAIINRVGMESYRILKDWAADNWHTPIERMTRFEELLEKGRKTAVFAIMAGRLSVALINVANLGPMARRLGAKGTMKAISSFWFGNGGVTEGRENIDFVLRKSVFMRNRSQTMDRDLQRGNRFPVEKDASKLKTSVILPLTDAAEQYGYKLIAYTDMMFSLTEWKYVYEETAMNERGKGKSAEEVDDAAILAADRAVRQTFGSGEVKDLSPVQKQRFLKHLLPFYSYSSLVLNQFIQAGYKIRDGAGMSDMLAVIMTWYALPVVMEAAVRTAMGDDDDKWDLFLRRLSFGVITGGPVQGVPVLRDASQWFAGKLTDVYAGDSPTGTLLALDVFDQAGKAYETIASKRKDWTDAGRQISRTANRVVGLPDMLTDGFWGLMRFMFTDTDATWMDLLTGIAFDRRVESEREKKARGAK